MDKIILASQSPRRKQLLEMAEVEFDIMVANIDETFPKEMPAQMVPEYLAKNKAAAIAPKVDETDLVIASDTVVILEEEILGKPKDEAEAISILQKLAGKTHSVVSGVCMQRGEQIVSFSSTTEVTFRKLSTEQITHYVTNYKPYDKAGAYAIQEWIGIIGIKRIKGDYYNVMGLPIGKVVKALNGRFSTEND